MNHDVYVYIYDMVVGMEALYVLVAGLYDLVLVCGYVPNHDIFVCMIW